MKRSFIAALAAALFSASLASAEEYKIGALVITQPMTFETPKMAMAGGGYLTVTNTGDTADRLIAVRADFPKVMLHTTKEVDGVAKMMHIDGVDIPAGGSASLEPGGMHVMFMGLRGNPLEVGDTFAATLVFEQAGEVEVMFNVEKRGAAMGGGMGASGHGATN